MRKIVILLIIGMACTAGCVQKKQLFNWGTYSTTLYNYKKAPTEENLQLHKENLAKIIQASQEQDLRVPPGVCCEYGYLLLKEGRTDEGIQYLEMEAQTYPESKQFIQRLIDSAAGE